jgi:hypothetical protein
LQYKQDGDRQQALSLQENVDPKFGNLVSSSNPDQTFFGEETSIKELHRIPVPTDLQNLYDQSTSMTNSKVAPKVSQPLGTFSKAPGLFDSFSGDLSSSNVQNPQDQNRMRPADFTRNKTVDQTQTAESVLTGQGQHVQTLTGGPIHYGLDATKGGYSYNNMMGEMSFLDGGRRRSSNEAAYHQTRQSGDQRQEVPPLNPPPQHSGAVNPGDDGEDSSSNSSSDTDPEDGPEREQRKQVRKDKQKRKKKATSKREERLLSL